MDIKISDTPKQPVQMHQGKDAKLYKACQDFEAIFLAQLWREMQQSTSQGNQNEGMAGQYEEIYVPQFAQKMSSAGGIGLADLLYRQLLAKGPQTPTDTVETYIPLKKI